VQVYPAVDLKGGRVARFDGREPEAVYAPDPLAVARQFLASGASWLHVVDLDRAFRTGSDNDALIRRIASLDGARIQMGGSLVEVHAVERALALGADRVVVATEAAAVRGRLEEIVARVPPGRLAVAADVRSGRLAPRGAGLPLSLPPRELTRRVLDLGVQVVVYRDLDRDGRLLGPDLDGAAALLEAGAEVIIAGGISSLAHLEAARAAGLAGAIVGRALYEGRFSLREALACSA
jgi:phosphoribosylformimino-5-aminoimidazole carboxamide ribonucleotide (ProFAR) isomerase